jgi:hypothetical protein
MLRHLSVVINFTATEAIFSDLSCAVQLCPNAYRYSCTAASCSRVSATCDDVVEQGADVPALVGRRRRPLVGLDACYGDTRRIK